MTKKVLLLGNYDGVLYRFRKELLQRLIFEKYDVYVCCPDGELVKPMKDMGCRYIRCDYIDRRGTNPVEDFKLIDFYRYVMKRVKPDVVLTYTIKPNVYGGAVCANMGIPYIANVTGLGSAVENGGFLQKITLTLYKHGLRKAQKVFFQNTENRDFMLEHGIINVPYEVLPGSGVNLEQYKLLPYPENKTVDFFFIARVMKEKGIDEYLEAAKVIKKRHPETRFHICGFCEEDYEEILENMQTQGIIIYHGMVEDMIPIYKVDACTVLPSYHEGLNNVLLESAASGRPVITTDISGCKEVVDDETTGYLIKKGDSKDLIDKIEKFLGHSIEQKTQMGVAGRKKAEQEFDRNIVVTKYMKELNYCFSSVTC